MPLWYADSGPAGSLRAYANPGISILETRPSRWLRPINPAGWFLARVSEGRAIDLCLSGRGEEWQPVFWPKRAWRE